MKLKAGALSKELEEKKLKAGALSKELEETKRELLHTKSELSSVKSELSAISSSRLGSGKRRMTKVLHQTSGNKRVVQQRLSDVGIIGA